MTRNRRKRLKKTLKMLTEKNMSLLMMNQTMRRMMTLIGREFMLGYSFKKVKEI